MNKDVLLTMRMQGAACIDDIWLMSFISLRKHLRKSILLSTWVVFILDFGHFLYTFEPVFMLLINHQIQINRYFWISIVCRGRQDFIILYLITGSIINQSWDQSKWKCILYIKTILLLQLVLPEPLEDVNLWDWKKMLSDFKISSIHTLSIWFWEHVHQQ